MGHFHCSPQLHINKHSLLQYILCFDIDFYSSPTQVKVPPSGMTLGPTRNMINVSVFEVRMTDKSIKDISRQHIENMLMFFCALFSVSERGHWIFQHIEYHKYSGSKCNCIGETLCSIKKES